MRTRIKTLKLLQDLLIDYDYYNGSMIRVIDQGKDWAVNDKLSYGNWLDQIRSFEVLKLEGLESIQNITGQFKKHKIKNIHAFYNQKSGFSFKWHSDNIQVLLVILKGQKRLEIKNKVFNLRVGDAVIIPKGHKHRAWSTKGTWALSIGLE